MSRSPMRAVLRFVLIALFLVLPISALTVRPVLAQDVTPEATPEVESTLPPNALSDFPGPGEYTVQLEIGGVLRSIAVYIPDSYTLSFEPFPLVVVLHGAGGTGNGIETFSGWSELSRSENFIVIYPDGVDNVWNDGRIGDPRISAIDDVSFINAAINFIADKLNIDQTRIYAAGFSMGGMLSFRLACQLPDRLAAIASVASTMPEYVVPYCSAGETMPVLIIQGTSDNVVPFYGIPRQGLGLMSAANSLLWWTRQNECATSSAIEPLEDVDPTDDTRVLLQSADDCANDAEVRLYGVYNGGHNYPGYAGIGLGAVSYDIDATALIWSFFEEHARADS